MAISFKACIVDGCNSNSHRDAHGRAGLCNTHYLRVRKFGDPHAMKIAKSGVPLSFVHDLVSRQGWPRDECILWPYGRNGGYGSVKVNGKTKGAHVIVCEAVHGLAPEGAFEVRHLCGNGAGGCVNPNHLAWGSHAQNMADTIGTRGETAPRGERQWNAKLTREQVRLIRDRIADGETYAAVACEFGVSQTTIGKIARHEKRRWLHG